MLAGWTALFLCGSNLQMVACEWSVLNQLTLAGEWPLFRFGNLNCKPSQLNGHFSDFAFVVSSTCKPWAKSGRSPAKVCRWIASLIDLQTLAGEWPLFGIKTNVCCSPHQHQCLWDGALLQLVLKWKSLLSYIKEIQAFKLAASSVLSNILSLKTYYIWRLICL